MTSRIGIAQAAAFALLLSSVICVNAGEYQAGPDTSTPEQRSIGTRQQAKGIPNFGEVTPNLYRGGLPNGDGLAALKKMAVNVVVDLRGGRNAAEEAMVTKLGMQYVSIPSHCPFPSDEPWARFLRVIRENAGKKIFVHCRLGDDRTGMAVAAYRMSEQGWPADEAMKEMRTFGFSTMHHAICPGMAQYEERFPEKLKTNRAFKELQSSDASSAPK